MEASALTHSPALLGPSPLLRLQGDEKLIALVRRGNHGAFEALVQRYQPRLLAFCRHMLGSTEDAEDVLQEVFASAFNAIRADNRPINARPWLYRIARNRCLNHLRRPAPAGQDSMDIFERDGGATTADTVHKREEFRDIVSDVQLLPETQRTALLLREIDALSYEQIAETMDTTVPSVKSLLVRARVSLAEAAEARLLTCAEVRDELAEVSEGLARSSAPVRRHLKTCDSCTAFRAHLRKTSRALAAIYPLGPIVILKLALAKVSLGAAGGSAGGAASAGGAIAASGAGGAFAGGATVGGGAIAASGAAAGGGGLLSTAIGGTLVSKAAAGLAAAAIVTAGAVEVEHKVERTVRSAPAVATAPASPKAQATPPSPKPLAAPAAAAAGKSAGAGAVAEAGQRRADKTDKPALAAEEAKPREKKPAADGVEPLPPKAKQDVAVANPPAAAPGTTPPTATSPKPGVVPQPHSGVSTGGQPSDSPLPAAGSVPGANGPGASPPGEPRTSLPAPQTTLPAGEAPAAPAPASGSSASAGSVSSPASVPGG